MRRMFATWWLATALAGLFLSAVTGCQHNIAQSHSSPVSAGLNTRDLIDPIAHDDANDLAPVGQLVASAERLRKDRQYKLEDQSKQEGGASSTHPNRIILCLSGGGSFGAYSAGVLVGWSERGDRPNFDVVTGISTGALIAVPAFLGPSYDEYMKSFYTTLKSDDLFKMRLILGLFSEALADTSPLKRRIDAFLTPQVMNDLAEAHRKGRRLYIGTTEQEGRRFIVWDIGAIAVRNGPEDRDLIANILLGSSAAPGLFPSAKIKVSVDGVPYTERHVDGGVSQALFFRPPHVAPDQRSDVAARDLGGAKVYVIVAGKLYADPEVIRPWSLAQAGTNVSTLIYAQTRGDLQRLYTLCLLSGMDYYLSAIPPEFNGTTSSAEFKPAAMTALFDEGRRVMHSEKPWRTLPPGFGPGESVLTRAGTELTYRQRGPMLPILGAKGTSIAPLIAITDQSTISAGPLVPQTK
jgi:predicted acylesterase/phospholipase RssA